jgi:hypothetical protein
MNLFNIKKRRTWSYEEWMKNRKVAEGPDPKQMEKGDKNDTKKEGMDAKGVDTPGNKSAALTDDNINIEKGNKNSATKATYDKAETPSKDAVLDDPKRINVTQGVK